MTLNYGKLKQFQGLLFICLISSACAKGGEVPTKTAASSPDFEQCIDTLPETIRIEAGLGSIGSDSFYPEERPVRFVEVGAFDIDATEVTNADFQKFVEATGYMTDAEKPQPGFDVIGGAVFTEPTPDNPGWWRFVEGANWRYPEGPESSIEGKENEPVVQISFNDARAYAEWTGRRLPTEVEWEYAAWGGAKTNYVWGDELTLGGKEMANRWQGAFPIDNTKADGYVMRAPAGCFPPNGFGLYDMIGNVWEWTATEYQASPQNSAAEKIYTIKGGSYLCAENYCQRYRASARQPQEAGLPTNHIGFRTVGDVDE